jgi:predicted dehydrogenase
MAEAVRFGVVGMGARGRQGWLHSLSLHPDARVVAVCDEKEWLARQGAREAGLDERAAHVRLDDLLARPDVDAVVIAVEPRRNADAVVRALEAGKHVLCEVPLALTMEDCWRVVLAAERSGRLCAMAEQTCHTPFAAAWRRLVSTGAMGKVTYGEAQYINGKGLDRYWRDARTGARLTWEQARDNPHAEKTHFWDLYHVILYSTHSLAPLLHVLDDRVVRVTCMATRRPSYYLEEEVGAQVPLPDIQVALMHTAKDTILRMAVGFVSPMPGPEPHHYYHLLGTRGEVETGRRRGSGPPGLAQAYGGSSSLMWLADSYLNGRVETEWDYSPYDPRPGRARVTGNASGHSGLDYYPLHEFVACLQQGGRPTVDVYRAADLAGAAILAAESDEGGATPQTVPDFRPTVQRPAGEPPAPPP